MGRNNSSDLFHSSVHVRSAHLDLGERDLEAEALIEVRIQSVLFD